MAIHGMEKMANMNVGEDKSSTFEIVATKHLYCHISCMALGDVVLKICG